MKISILMPVKNESLYLQDTLKSILKQSETNFELIAVNDHSTDNSADIIQKFAKMDDRISLYQNQGTGIIDALITAYQNSAGELITRMDADDLMPNYKLEVLKKLLLNNGKGTLATGRVKYFSETELGAGFKQYEKWLNDLSENGNYFEQLFKECVIASPNWLLFREDIDKINGFTDLIYPEDYHFIFKLFENNIKIKSSDLVTHLWRDHPLRASRNLAQYADQKFYRLKMDYYLKFYGDRNINIWGTGPSGKQLAKELIKRDIQFKWQTNNPNKIGQQICGIFIDSYENLKKQTAEKLIIAVNQRNSIEEIKAYLTSISFKNYIEF